MKFDPNKTAFITLDLQKTIFDFIPSAKVIIPAAEKAVMDARKNKYKIIHVGIGFSPLYPEISSHNTSFLKVKEQGIFLKGSESAAFHPTLVEPEDIIIYKHRVSGFSENSLYMILRSNNIENLILCGVATSMVVLSTLRQAIDLDFKCIILKDACHDADEEVHRILIEKIFPSTPLCTVISSDDLQYSLLI